MYISYNSTFFLFLIIFGLRFFGQGAMYHAGETTMTRYFGNNRGKALSVSTFGGMIGVSILPIIVVKLTYLIGWQNVWLLASLTILVFFIPLLFLALQNQVSRHSNFIKYYKTNLNNRKWKIRELIFDKKLYIYLPITIATPLISTGLTFHQIFIINQKGWSLELLASSFVFLGIFSILGIILGGLIVDKYKAKKIIIYTLVPLFLAMLVLIFFNHPFFMLIYMSLLGINIGIGTPIVGSFWAEIYGLESIGTVKALLHASMVFFSALSPALFGYMIDFGMGIQSLTLISILIIIISTLLPIFFKGINE